LHYRSAYNPCYYLLNGKLYVLPTPSSSITRAIVNHLDYKTTTYASTVIDDFPDEYEELIVLYAAAKSCQSAATNIQNNMPEIPEPPQITGFEDVDDVDIPDFPIYVPPKFNVTSGSISNAIAREDFDKADKTSDVVSKNLEIFKQENDLIDMEYQKDSKNFDSELDSLHKDMDRKHDKIISELRSKVSKYQYEISSYSQELQEKFTKYRWFIEQYIHLMNEYNQNMQFVVGQRQTPGAKTPKGVPTPKQEQKIEGEEYGS
jgi:hypothetical protein